MAIIGPSGPPHKVQRIRGLVDVYIRRGKLVARAWPSKRGRGKTGYARALVQRFREVNEHIKCAHPREITCLRDALARYRGRTRGLRGNAIIRERDWMIRVAYGRMWAIELPDGRVLWPEPLAQDISDALDWLEPRLGCLMVRTSRTWLPTFQCHPGWIFCETPDGVYPDMCPPAEAAGRDDAVGLYAP